MKKDIRKVMESDMNDAEKIRELNFLIRKDYIYIKKSIIEIIKGSGTVTIDRKDALFSLEPNDNNTEYLKLYGYSFGPFKPSLFFSKNRIRILWVLKEPLLCDINQMNGRIEGFAQDQFYSTWQQIENDEWDDKRNCPYGTKTQVINITQKVLLNLAKLLKNRFSGIDLLDKNEIINHISIIELNHFPGISIDGNWKSDNSKVTKWALANKNILTSQIILNKPDIVFFMRDFGEVVSTFLSNGVEENYKTSIFNVAHATGIREVSPIVNLQNCYPFSKIAGREVVDCGPIETYTNKGTATKCSYILDSNHCIWIGFHHPVSGYWSDDNILTISEVISRHI